MLSIKTIISEITKIKIIWTPDESNCITCSEIYIRPRYHKLIVVSECPNRLRVAVLIILHLKR